MAETGTLEDTIYPYLDIEGVAAAALVATDGLLVSSVGDTAGFDLEAVAAYAATTISAADELSSQLSTGNKRVITLDIPERGLIIAPVTRDLLLVLIGRQQSILSLVNRSFI